MLSAIGTILVMAAVLGIFIPVFMRMGRKYRPFN